MKTAVMMMTTIAATTNTCDIQRERLIPTRLVSYVALKGYYVVCDHSII